MYISSVPGRIQTPGPPINPPLGGIIVNCENKNENVLSIAIFHHYKFRNERYCNFL